MTSKVSIDQPFSFTFITPNVLRLYVLCFQARNPDHHDEVELLLEGYRSDFLQIQLDLGSIRGQIDDAREFINTHQVSNEWK